MTKRVDEASFDKTMRCYVRGVEYDYARKRGAIWIDEDDHPDMASVIEFFRSIDKNVETIDTFHGGWRDSC
jgi:hypothetical protein